MPIVVRPIHGDVDVDENYFGYKLLLSLLKKFPL